MGARLDRAVATAKMHVQAAEQITAKAVAAGRDLTADEERQAQRHIELGRAAAEQAKQAKADELMSLKIAELGGGIGLSDDDLWTDNAGRPLSSVKAGGDPRSKALGGSSWGAALVRHHTDGMGYVKALLPSGAVPVTVPAAPEPVRAGEPVLALRQLIPTLPDSVGRWSYFRQTLRDSNAAVVAPGARKPTSVFSLERVEGRAVTLAHLSESLNRADLDDAALLREFVDTELRLGLETALEDEIVNGDGTGEHFSGLSNTSGTQSQGWAGDLMATTRAALTKLEVLSLTGSGWVFAPADWERIELSANAYGYALAQAGQAVPVDRAARRLWGIPVAVSTTVPVGIGYVADFAGSTELRIREDARVDWSENLYSPDQFGTGQGGSLFEANQIVFRCEMRAGWAIKRPPGVVEIDLTA